MILVEDSRLSLNRPVAAEMRYLPMVWRIRAAKAQALGMLGDAEAAAREYEAATAVIQKLADTIPDAELKGGFLSNPLVSSIIDTSSQRFAEQSKSTLLA